MDNTRVNRTNNMIVIIEPQANCYEVQRWRHFRLNRQMAKEEQQRDIAKATSEIVATFFDGDGTEIETKILHRKLLHLETGMVVEGFFTGHDEQFITVTTNTFAATLEKASVYIKKPGTPHYEQVIRWWVKPTVFNENQGGRSEC